MMTGRLTSVEGRGLDLHVVQVQTISDALEELPETS